jgi:hypothetical protein
MAQEVEEILSHWHHLIEGLKESPSEVYAAIEQAVDLRRLPGIRCWRIEHREGGVFSARREYLRVRRDEYIFDICAAPFGTGFFMSWWLGEVAEAWWAQIPLIGPILRRLFRPYTYYRMDVALMFRESVHAAVMEVLDKITTAKGLRALSELDRKPVMTDLMQRLSRSA